MLRHKIRFILILAALLGGLAPALAQSAPNGNIFDLLRSIFSPQPPRPAPTEPARPKKKRTGQPSPLTTGNKQTPVKPAVPPSFFVQVLGDSLGDMLAQGLTEALSDKPEILVTKRTRDASGLVRDDFYDWRKITADLLNGPDKTDVAVIMIGSNDHQPFLKDGKVTIPVDSEEWINTYRARVDAEAKLFQDKHVKLIWVGLPVMHNVDYAHRMARLNEIYRDAAGANGAEYIDIWDLFANEKGDYDQNGPDLNGQIVRLRTTDGIHFTKAGTRKLASLVEKDIRRLFDENQPRQDLVTPTPSANNPDIPSAPGEIPPPVKVERPVSGPVISLTALPSASGSELVPTLRNRKPLGILPPATLDPHPGRADDFSWAPAAETPAP